MFLRHIKAKYLFILPAVLVLLSFSIFPVIASLILSFSSFSLAQVEQRLTFVGFANYGKLFTDSRFLFSLKNTFMYVFLGAGLQYLLGLSLAMLIYEQTIANRVYRVLFLIPMMLTPVAISYTWRMMFHETYGPVNHILRLLELPGVPWLSSTKVALLSVMLVDTWQWTPFTMLALLAGRMSISREYYDAAGVDGANKLQTFAYITFPLLIPVSLTVILIRSIEIAKIVDIIYVMTGGGPGIATESLTMYGYITGLKRFNLGYASALAYTLLVMVLVFGLLFLRIRRRLE
jgi:multiple sugar transport system permease protein